MGRVDRRGGCLRWVELRFCWCKLQFLVELRGLGLAAVAVHVVVFISELARMGFLTARAI